MLNAVIGMTAVAVHTRTNTKILPGTVFLENHRYVATNYQQQNMNHFTTTAITKIAAVSYMIHGTGAVTEP